VACAPWACMAESITMRLWVVKRKFAQAVDYFSSRGVKCCGGLRL
jgi:hypothetical protein